MAMLNTQNLELYQERNIDMDKKPEFHGSDLEKIEEYYHIPKEEIICFSANVNPLGLSKKVKKELASNLDVITRYPDRNYTSLREAIGNYCDASPAHIVVGNGSTELISLLISQRAPKKALLLGPTYSEYNRELSLINASTETYLLREEDDFLLNADDFLSACTEDIDLVIICNPNNPTSSAIQTGDMERIIRKCKKRNIFVMIDETYVEFAPCIEEITAIPLTKRYDNLMVIRGVSKFYAAPGLRFGYGITSSEAFLKSLHQHQNPWSLNSVGAYTGELMLKDTDYFRETRALILSERERMFARLSHMDGYKPYAAYGNFILVRILKEGLTSFDVFEAAIKNRLMIRDCSSFESLTGEYIRFCIMNPEDNDRLLHVLNSLI